jgi:two-component system, LytTR family, sensor kinase
MSVENEASFGDGELPTDGFRLGRTLVVATIAWLLFSVVNATQVYLSMLEHGHSYVRLGLYNVAVWGLWVFLTPIARHLALRWPLVPFTSRAFFLHLAGALLIGTLHVAAWIQLTISIRPYDAMTIVDFGQNFWPALGYRLQFEVLVYGVIVGLSAAVDYAERLHRREVEAQRLLAQLTTAKLHALELQLRPHFLFNTLNTITGLVRGSRNQEAVETIVRLSDLLHQTLATEETPLIPLEREIALLRTYLEIEQIRFSDRLQVDVDVEPAALAARIPPFVLQPLAENAVRHGISRVAGAAELRVSARRVDDRVLIEVRNTGPALRRDASGVGLANTRERLRQVYGDAASLELDDVPGGVRARITVPLATEKP